MKSLCLFNNINTEHINESGYFGIKIVTICGYKINYTFIDLKFN